MNRRSLLKGFFGAITAAPIIPALAAVKMPGAVNGALPLTFCTNGTERMRIDSSGNIGIGCAPKEIKL